MPFRVLMTCTNVASPYAHGTTGRCPGVHVCAFTAATMAARLMLWKAISAHYNASQPSNRPRLTSPMHTCINPRTPLTLPLIRPA